MEHLGPMQAQGQEGLAHQGKRRLESLTGCHLVYINTGGEKKVLVHWAPNDRISFVLPHTWYLTSLRFVSLIKVMSSFWVYNDKDHILFIIYSEGWSKVLLLYMCFPCFHSTMFIKELDMYRQAKIQRVKQGMVPAPIGACSPWGNKTIIK